MTRQMTRRRWSLALALSAGALCAFASPAVATLQLNRPDPSVPATFVGRGGYSSDGLGQLSPGGYCCTLPTLMAVSQG